jgi:serpin B
MAQLLQSTRHTAGDGWQAVELRYIGDTLAMWVIVPEPGITPRQVLTPETLAAIGDGLQPGAVDLRMPRWDFDTDVSLIPVLTALGMHAPFDPDAADFSRIADTGLWIGDAIHRATITVDEWGTEAAAVTGLAFDDTQAHTPLFLGQVADPRN